MSEYRWVHYTGTADAIIPFSVLQADAMDRFFKPKGLWITPENTNHSWYDWCVAEEFGLRNLSYIHDVKLSTKANLLILNGASELDMFTKQYARDNAMTRLSAIDWQRVATDYQGVLIPRYIWERRLDGDCGWYYGWDCGSGCIWDSDAIESVILRGPMMTDFDFIANAEKSYQERRASYHKLLADIKRERNNDTQTAEYPESGGLHGHPEQLGFDPGAHDRRSA